MDFISNLDPTKLVLACTFLSFIISPFTSPPYNLPIFLFGFYVQDNSEAQQSLQTFTGLLCGSIVFDIIWMFTYKQNPFIKFLSVVLLLLKIPAVFAFGLALRQRGGHFSGLGIRDGDLSGPPVWTMPARDGYQSLDEPIERNVPANKPANPGAPNSNPNVTAPGAYQTV